MILQAGGDDQYQELTPKQSSNLPTIFESQTCCRRRNNTFLGNREPPSGGRDTPQCSSKPNRSGLAAPVSQIRTVPISIIVGNLLPAGLVLHIRVA